MLPAADPVALYVDLRQNQARVRLRERPIVHGDLHMSNVALDSTPRGPEAYIFDPGVIRRSTAGRDLAVLRYRSCSTTTLTWTRLRRFVPSSTTLQSRSMRILPHHLPILWLKTLLNSSVGSGMVSSHGIRPRFTLCWSSILR